MRIVSLLAVVGLSCLLGSTPASPASPASSAPSAPEYMKIKFAIGQAFEVEGRWDSVSNVFIAEDIEALPQARRPKLRGAIQKIDPAKQTLTMYGLQLQVTKETEFLGDRPGSGFDALKIGMRVEVSCMVESGHQWQARKISSHDIKNSDKVKGTLSQMKVDGKSPDTLDLEGLKILLTVDTDVKSASGSIEQRENILFQDLGYQEIEDVKGGKIIGDKMVLAAEYRQEIRSKSDYSLTKTVPSNISLSLFDTRVSSLGYWSSNLRTEAELRFRTDYVLSSDDTIRKSSKISGRFILLNVLLKDIGTHGLALQVGRQNFVEPREWLFDEYLDAIRLYYYGAASWQVQGAYIHGINPVQSKYENWTDLFGMVDWFVNSDNTVSAYFLSRKDSDTTRDTTSGLTRDRKPVWWGLRWMGKPASGIKGWTDLSIMRGTDKQKQLQAWAFDAGATYTFRSLNIRPSFALGYAIGSGDSVKNDDIDHRFRQTGYQDNTNSLGGKASFAYYGAVLRPELSNLGILTVSASARPITESSVQLIYHSYRQRQVYDRFTGSDLVLPTGVPNGTSNDIGTELDAVFTAPKLWNHFQLTLVLGMFSPGAAYTYRDKAFLSQLSIEASI